ncbi:hypothetical protein BDW74DRAFT_156956 [Aspergillus multicolor]|uniref:uncharacterized protein n=1 Tax=Aspergillus multicolor TaxID=41759 RepID=UPI003CCDB10D
MGMAERPTRHESDSLNFKRRRPPEGSSDSTSSAATEGARRVRDGIVGARGSRGSNRLR